MQENICKVLQEIDEDKYDAVYWGTDFVKSVRRKSVLCSSGKFKGKLINPFFHY